MSEPSATLTGAEADLLREAIVTEWREALEATSSSLGSHGDDADPGPISLTDAACHVRRQVELLELLERRVGFECVPGGGPLLPPPA